MKIGSLLLEILKSPFKGKSVLCHSTTYSRAIDIINDNEIYAATRQTIKTKLNTNNRFYNQNSKNYSGVSFTRDWSLEYSDVQFILDRDSIVRDYGKNLVPFDFYHYTNKGKSNPNRINTNENEEFLVGDLNNMSKYLLGIRIMEVYERLDNFKEEDPEGYEIFRTVVGKVPVYDKNFKEIIL